MITYAIIRVLERRGVDRYTIMAWRSRLLSRHHQAVLETIVVLLVLLMVLLFATVSVGAASAQGAAAVDRGQKVYAAEKCGICHSVAGAGNKRGALDEVGSKLSQDEIRQWIVNAAEMTAKTKATRKPPMQSYSHLPKEDVDGLVAYMQSLKKS